MIARKISLKKIENKESLQMEDIDEIFSYTVASEITNDKDDSEPKSIMECQNRHDWIKWKDVM